jgi:coenzyme F420-0:L-glutamate ligase/coenzyme F420-1:gamma-L-glutamate ligase
MKLTLTTLEGIPEIRPGDDLADILWKSLQQNNLTLEDGDILVLAQKIVSKAEGRLRYLPDVTPGDEAKRLAPIIDKDPRFVELILQESNEVVRTRKGVIVVEHRLGFVCANAGIDHSNVRGESGNPEEWVLLLPENPDMSAQTIRRRLEASSGARIGVLIIDSHGRAWRNGIIGTAIGLSGMPGLVDRRGVEDRFGYQLRITQIGSADELAGAASMLMGQAAEGRPAVHVRGFPYPLREGSISELVRSKEQDLFR